MLTNFCDLDRKAGTKIYLFKISNSCFHSQNDVPQKAQRKVSIVALSWHHVCSKDFKR